VRRSIVTFGLDLPYGLNGAVLRRPACAERHGKKFGAQCRKLLAHSREFFHPSGVCGGKNSKLNSCLLMQFSLVVWPH